MQGCSNAWPWQTLRVMGMPNSPSSSSTLGPYMDSNLATGEVVEQGCAELVLVRDVAQLYDEDIHAGLFPQVSERTPAAPRPL